MFPCAICQSTLVKVPPLHQLSEQLHTTWLGNSHLERQTVKHTDVHHTVFTCLDLQQWLSDCAYVHISSLMVRVCAFSGFKGQTQHFILQKPGLDLWF